MVPDWELVTWHLWSLMTKTGTTSITNEISHVNFHFQKNDWIGHTELVPSRGCPFRRASVLSGAEGSY